MPNVGPRVHNPLTAVQDSATAISKGHVVLLNAVADGTKVVRCAADNAAKILGVAVTDSPGQNKAFPVAGPGDIVWAKCDAAVAQGPVMGSSSGGIKTAAATAATVINLVGLALEDGASGDYVAVLVTLGSKTNPA